MKQPQGRHQEVHVNHDLSLDHASTILENMTLSGQKSTPTHFIQQFQIVPNVVHQNYSLIVLCSHVNEWE